MATKLSVIPFFISQVSKALTALKHAITCNALCMFYIPPVSQKVLQYLPPEVVCVVTIVTA